MGKLFKPDIPKAAKEEPIPVADDTAIEDEKKKATSAAQRRGGRASTILSDENKLGGG